MKGTELRYFFKYHFGTSYPYRKYFKKHKVIFIHIPKTAGTSILSVLAGKGKIRRDHTPWNVYSSINRWRFARYFKFTFVRNPYDRAVSTYEYLAKGGNGMDDMVFKTYFEEHGIDFDRFVLEYLDCDKLLQHELFRPQYVYIYDFHENLKVDYVGRFETIEKDYAALSEKIGLAQELPKKNMSNRSRSYREYYKNPKVAARILELYGKDFDLLGYDKAVGGADAQA